MGPLGTFMAHARFCLLRRLRSLSADPIVASSDMKKAAHWGGPGGEHCVATALPRSLRAISSSAQPGMIVVAQATAAGAAARAVATVAPTGLGVAITGGSAGAAAADRARDWRMLQTRETRGHNAKTGAADSVEFVDVQFANVGVHVSLLEGGDHPLMPGKTQRHEKAFEGARSPRDLRHAQSECGDRLIGPVVTIMKLCDEKLCDDRDEFGYSRSIASRGC